MQCAPASARVQPWGESTHVRTGAPCSQVSAGMCAQVHRVHCAVPAGDLAGGDAAVRGGAALPAAAPPAQPGAAQRPELQLRLPPRMPGAPSQGPGARCAQHAVLLWRRVGLPVQPDGANAAVASFSCQYMCQAHSSVPTRLDFLHCMAGIRACCALHAATGRTGSGLPGVRCSPLHC